MGEAPKSERVDELSPERVRHVALLSRLDLGEDELGRFSRELSGVVKHLNKLSELDLSGVEPTSHAIPTSNVFRPDAVAASLTPAEALANAPEQEDNCFKVPQII
jgi:aspartyl-tRNA(Asn)/glutamyl-tRNA(Gln) amidotransferase subunit C